MDSRKTIDVDDLIAVMKSQGRDTGKIESFLGEVREDRKNTPTTANSEGIQISNIV
ncbi:hypothetical protein [Brevibacillus invocatus]|uniref:hypothetical protein n=1 Tax=Brevibacillus invocatus TaxID=173959 RepID=UPI0016059D09|nr:hypothetical protein [Brevibacillus invocatus]